MKKYDNTNRGALFKNTEKENPKHADYKGNINVNGQEFWLDAWVNVGKSGVKYMSLSIKPKKAAAKASARVDYNDSTDIPF